MPSAQKLDTHHKALNLDLDPSTFGSLAEIGAGQEVARWFLLMGGASGTPQYVLPVDNILPRPEITGIIGKYHPKAVVPSRYFIRGLTLKLRA